jgi:hypothetical protein
VLVVPANTPAVVVSRPTRRLLLSVAPAASPPTEPLVLNPAGAALSDARKVSFSAAAGAALVTDTLRSATVSPRWTMPKSTTVVFACATAGVYTRPVSATFWPASAMSAAPVVSGAARHEAHARRAGEAAGAGGVQGDAERVARRALPPSPVIDPDPEKPAPAVPMLALSRSVKTSAETLVTPSAAVGAGVADPRGKRQ